MRTHVIVLILFTTSLVLLACIPGGAPVSNLAGSTAQVIPAPKMLTIGIEDEPLNLATLLAGGSSSGNDFFNAVHQRLAYYDERGEVHPGLAVDLPTQSNNTWMLRPDGTMQTTYRVHRGVTWHDGTQLAARDFVLGHLITSDPDLPVSQRSVSSQIERIDTPDDFTLVIEWKGTYPFANAIVQYDLGPFPTHILGEMYRTEKERIPNSLYWTHQFVGVGPYRLAEWHVGSHLVLQAHDAFFRGRSKIDTLVLRIIENPATVMANMLAGTIDGASTALDFAGAMTVKREWEREGKKPVFIAQPTHYRRLGVQFRVPNPQDITDVRIRRGLMHAIDRQALVDVLFEGFAPHADTFIPPDETKWEWVKDVVNRYDLDQRRAVEVLTDAGWRRATNGSWTNKAGEKFALGLWASGAGEPETQVSIVRDAWKRIGLDVDLKILTPAENRDDQVRVSYPSFSLATFPANYQFGVLALHSRQCPSEQTRWRGNNRGCFQNAESDRLIDAISVAIQPEEQRRLYRDFVKFQTETLPELPLFFAVRTTVFREGVSGVKGFARPDGGYAWNTLEWNVR